MGHNENLNVFKQEFDETVLRVKLAVEQHYAAYVSNVLLLHSIYRFLSYLNMQNFILNAFKYLINDINHNFLFNFLKDVKLLQLYILSLIKKNQFIESFNNIFFLVFVQVQVQVQVRTIACASAVHLVFNFFLFFFLLLFPLVY